MATFIAEAVAAPARPLCPDGVRRPGFQDPYVGGYGTITGISLVIAWYA
jgi:hypothetical protein